MFENGFYFVGIVLFEAFVLFEDFISLQETHLLPVEELSFSVFLEVFYLFFAYFLLNLDDF
jgi:hypothetical protein